MKYLSEKTNKAYSSVEDLQAAEKEYDVKQAEVEKKNKDQTFSISTTEIPPSYTEDTINTSNNINTYVLHFNREESEIKSFHRSKESSGC